MVYKKNSRLFLLSKSLDQLEALHKQSSALDLEIKKGLRSIFPELVIDYDEIAHNADLGSFFSASINYGEKLKALKLEAKEIIKEGITGGMAEDAIEKVGDSIESAKESIEAKEKLAGQIKYADRRAGQAIFVYSNAKLDSITLSYIESPDSALRKMLSKYRLDKLIISASCKGMMANNEYSDVALRYKTFASSYSRALLGDSQIDKAKEMVRDGTISGIINDYIFGLEEIFNVNIEPRLINGKSVLELASEAYYYEDYHIAVRRAHDNIMERILQRL